MKSFIEWISESENKDMKYDKQYFESYRYDERARFFAYKDVSFPRNEQQEKIQKQVINKNSMMIDIKVYEDGAILGFLKATGLPYNLNWFILDVEGFKINTSLGFFKNDTEKTVFEALHEITLSNNSHESSLETHISTYSKLFKDWYLKMKNEYRGMVKGKNFGI